MALSTTNLTAKQREQVLNYIAATAASKTMTAQQLLECSADQKQALIKAGIITAKEAETGTTIALTKEKIKEILADETLSVEDKKLILGAFGVTGANLTEANSFKMLTAAIWSSIKAMAKWMVTNPVGQIALFIGILAGAKGVYNLFTTSVKEAQESLEEFNQTCSDLESVSNELTSIDDKIKAIQDKGTLSLTDQADLSRLEQERKLLEKEIELLELKKELTEEKSNSDAVKSVNDGTYKNGDGFFDRDVDDLINVIKTQPSYFGAYSESTRNNAKQAYADAKVELADLQRRNIELLGQITGDDEASVNARKELQEYIDYVNQYLYTAEELQKMKFDDFLGENENIKKAFDDLSNNGADVTAESIENLASKFPSLKTYMDENGISAETLAAEFAKTSSEAETAGENANKMTVSLSKTADKIKELYSFVKEIDDDGLSPDSIEKIISEYPELIGYIGDEVRLRTELKKKITEEETKYKQALRSKVMASSSFAELVESKNQELFKELGLAYNKDTQKFELESRRKAAIAIKDATTAANAWAQIYADEQVLSAPDFTTELHASGKNSKYKTQSGDWKFEVFNDGKLKTYTYEAGSSMAKILDSQRELSKITNFDIDFGDDSSSKDSYEDLYDEFLETLEQEVENLDNSIERINTKLEHAIKTGDAEQIQILSKELDDAYAQKKELLETKANEARAQLALIMEEIYDIAPYLRGRNINEITPYEIEEISMSLGDASGKWDSITKSAQNYYETISEWSDKWWENEDNKLGNTEKYYDTLLDEVDRYVDRIEKSRQEEIDALDKQITKEEALLKIKQGQYDTTNKLKEAQKDIDKEIANSRNSKQYLSEFEYDKIFGDADYEFLSGEIENITNDIAGISANFYKQIEDAYANDQLYLVEAITAEYERQLASKERELEIAKAKVDLEKKRLTLENAKNERNIKQYSENGITWVADQEKVKQATEDFIDAQATIKDLQEKSAQQMELDRRQANIDMLNSQKESIEYQNELMNKAVENLKLAIEDVTDPLADLGSVLKTLVNDLNTKVSNAAKNVVPFVDPGFGGGSSGGGGGSNSSGGGGSTGKGKTNTDAGRPAGTGVMPPANSSNANTATAIDPDGNHVQVPRQDKIWVNGKEVELYDNGGFASGKGLMLKGVDEEETVLPPWLTKEILTPEYNENFSKLIENMQMVSQFSPSDFIVKPKTDSLLMKNINQPTSIAKTWTGNMYVEGGDPNEVLKAIDQAFDRITI